jgi:dTDP-4-dehydrorhamnose reductase
MNKKILILGGSSMVGSRVIELLSSKFEIIAPSSSELDLTNAGNFEKYCMDNRAKLVNATVINFVAYTNVDEAEKESGDEDGLCYRLNATLPGEISDWCKDLHERYIHISTDYVFDGEKQDSAYVEEDSTNPLGWYGKTKLIGEKYVEESGANYVTLRIEMPYGSNSEKKKDIATILFERLKNNQPIQAISDAQISPVYIDDLANVLEKLIEQQDIVGLYHVAPTDSVTLEQFVRLIAKHGRLDDSLVTTISFDEYWKTKLELGAAKRPKHSWMDSSNLQQQIGKEKFHSVEENIIMWLQNKE